MLSCLNCTSHIGKDDANLEMTLTISKDKTLKRHICKKCLTVDFVKNDRVIKKLFAELGQQTILDIK